MLHRHFSKLSLIFVLELIILSSRFQTALTFRQELINSLDTLKNIFSNVSLCDVHIDKYENSSPDSTNYKVSLCDKFQLLEKKVVNFIHQIQKDAKSSKSKLLSQVHAVRNTTVEYLLSHFSGNTSLLMSKVKTLRELNCSIKLPVVDWMVTSFPQNFVDPEFILNFDFEEEYNKRRLLDGCAFVLLLLILSIILPSISIKELFQQLCMRQKILLMSVESRRSKHFKKIK